MVKHSTLVVTFSSHSQAWTPTRCLSLTLGSNKPHSVLFRSICRNLRRQDVLSFFALRPAQGGTLICTGFVMHLHELGNVKLWLLQDLDLPDQAIFQWIDALALLLDLLPDDLWDQLLDEIAKLSLTCFFDHHIENLANLRRLCIAIGLHLIGPALCESNHEKTHHVAVCGLYIRVCLDQGVPFADQGALLIPGQCHAVKVCEAIASLHLLYTELDLLGRLILIHIQISQIHLQD